MTNPFTAFSFAAAGEPTNRTMPDRLADIINVRDFGALGDGITDDWAAIMGAFNWTVSSSRGTIFFPPGTYIVSQPIDFSGNNINVCFVGCLGLSTVKGNFGDYVFKRFQSGTGGFSGCHVVENLAIINLHATGGGLRIGDCVGAAVRNLVVTANQGIDTANNDTAAGVASLEVSIENCTLSPGSNTSGSNGIMSVSDGPILNCTMTGFDVGMCLWGTQAGMSVLGCRFVLCGIGAAPGRKPDGTSFGASSVTISGCWFKNCSTAILGGGGSCHLTGIRVEGTEGTIAGNPQYGIKLPANNQGNGTLQGVIVTGQFQQYGVFIEGGEAFIQQLTLIGVQSTNTSTLGGLAWNLPATAAGSAQFIGCNVAPVFTMAGLPAFPESIATISWSAGITTLTTSFGGLGPLVGSDADVTVSGSSPAGYNGVFSGVTIVNFQTITYAQTNPGAPTGSGGTVIINGISTAGANVREGDTYNVRDADTGTWGANPIGGGSFHAKVRWVSSSNWAVMGV